jgi:aryl-alcohol dehydrogenase-like predicted oxidoreductase
VAVAVIETRPLGGSGLSVPRVMLGCGNFGGVGSAPEFFGQGIDEDGAFALMDAAWELGLRHFDTADAYGGGRSEAMIGRWCAARGVRPAITTKTFNPMDAGADHGLAPERVKRRLAASLERLGTDRVELYLAHEYDPDVALEDTFGAFESARAEGLIGAYGVSNFDAEQLARAAAHGAPACVQNAFSLLERADEDGVLGVCAEHDIAYAAFGPLAGGCPTGTYRRGEPLPAGSLMTQRPEHYTHFLRDGVFDALETLERMARERGVSMGGMALAWLLGEPRLTAVVVGPTRPEHLEPVREALAHPLDAATRDELSRVFA